MNNNLILIVDDEEDIVIPTVNYLKKNLNDVEVLFAFNGSSALDILKQREVDVLVTDIRMPEMDGLELLLKAKELHPAMKAIVVTAYGSPVIRKQSKQAGALHYVEKPFELKQLTSVIKDLLTEGSGFTGSVDHLALSDIIQILCMSNKPAILEVTYLENKGYFYISEGEIFNCKTETADGEKACFEILSWPKGEFTVLPMGPETPERKIKRSWMSLLMETFKKIDETGGNSSSGNNTGNQYKEKLGSIVNSLIEKVEDVICNVLVDTEKKEVVFEGESFEENISKEKAESFAEILNAIDRYLKKNEDTSFEEVIFVFNNKFSIFMRINKKLVWCVKISGVDNLGRAKIALSKARERLAKEIEKLN